MYVMSKVSQISAVTEERARTRGSSSLRSMLSIIDQIPVKLQSQHLTDKFNAHLLFRVKSVHDIFEVIKSDESVLVFISFC